MKLLVLAVSVLSVGCAYIAPKSQPRLTYIDTPDGCVSIYVTKSDYGQDIWFRETATLVKPGQSCF
jgi:hypothetical protein